MTQGLLMLPVPVRKQRAHKKHVDMWCCCDTTNRRDCGSAVCDCEPHSWSASRRLARGPAATRWLSSAAPATPSAPRRGLVRIAGLMCRKRNYPHSSFGWTASINSEGQDPSVMTFFWASIIRSALRMTWWSPLRRRAEAFRVRRVLVM